MKAPHKVSFNWATLPLELAIDLLIAQGYTRRRAKALARVRCNVGPGGPALDTS